MPTTQYLPTDVHDLTARDVAHAIRTRTGRAVFIDDEGHGNVQVWTPAADGDHRVLILGYFNKPFGAPSVGDATIDTFDGWPAVAVEGRVGQILDDRIVSLDRDAPDVPQLYATLTVDDLLTFLVEAVGRIA